MKRILLLLFMTSMVGIALAQSPTEYKAHNEGWMVDIDKAYAASKDKGVPILANFTGSDWCGWCKRLTASVFSKADFKNWAEGRVILLELDFPRRTKLPEKYRKQNAGLQQAFKIRGYPTVWVFNLAVNADDGRYQIEALGKTGYAKSVSDFTTAIDQMIDR